MVPSWQTNQQKDRALNIPSMAEIQFDKKLTLCLRCAPPCCCDVTHIYGGQFGLAGFAHISNLESRYEFLFFFFFYFFVLEVIVSTRDMGTMDCSILHTPGPMAGHKLLFKPVVLKRSLPSVNQMKPYPALNIPLQNKQLF